MVNLLKEGGNDFDIDMDALLKKSMDSSVEDDKSPKKEDKAKKTTSKETSKKNQDDATEGSIEEDREESKSEDADSPLKADQDSATHSKQNESQPSDESLPADVVSGSETDPQDFVHHQEIGTKDSSKIESPGDRYDARYLSDCRIDEDGARVRINNDLLQKAKIILWYNPNVSVSSYVNNILRAHFRENQSILEQRMNEVSASIIDESI